MLEIKNLSKIYKPKRGLPVKALDDVSLTFPEKGMVFLLGKSGSGKSTLLNLLGGLDSYDSGEIIIAGSSSKKFRQSEFDSYRNTLVGFIFQEYNILEEFTVGANIGLALELQGKKATSEKISAILEEVDLQGYGARRPNELSGGQKQRVAIARALVKDPKIIMADEPTGALDSATGRQVLDTLKKLSREKLVLVVSHDREFAERYADRIIELSDGKVISDREYFAEEEGFKEEGILYGEGEIRVSAGYRLTEEDREQINSYLAAMEKGETLSLKGAGKISRASRETDHSAIRKIVEKVCFIPSRLPMKAAFRIGSGALKHKKIRLAFTILLSCVAFGLFGLADTFGAYDHVKTCTRSILDSNISYASLVKSIKVGEGIDSYYRKGRKILKEDLPVLEKESGVPLTGVFCPREEVLSFHSVLDPDTEFTKSDFNVYEQRFNGFAEIGEGDPEKWEMPLVAGRLPKGDQNEIVISTYLCETFYKGGFLSSPETEEKKAVYDPIQKPEDLLDRKITLMGEEYTVVGVVSASSLVDLERYLPLTEKSEGDIGGEIILNYALFQELDGIRSYSLATTALVGKGHLEKIVEKESPFLRPEEGHIEIYKKETGPDGEEFYSYMGAEFYGTLSDAKGYEILWLDGEKKTLEDNQVIYSFPMLVGQFGFSSENPEAYDPETGSIRYSLLTEEDKKALYDLAKDLSGLELERYFWYATDESARSKTVSDVEIVGILLPDESGKKAKVESVCLVSDALAKDILVNDGGIYSFAVGPMPKEEAGVKKLVSLSASQDEIRYQLQNPVTFELDAIHEIFLVLAKVFLYVGIGFAVFASLMLANFIGTSISYKKQEIGILRAIGARSNDVFRIFFSESFVIAMINFVLSAIGTFAVVTVINYFVRTETGILVTLLIFSLRQIAFLFGVSLLVAFLGSFFPVKRIAAKKPIDAIQGR